MRSVFPSSTARCCGCLPLFSPAAAPALLSLDMPLLAPSFFHVRHMFPSSCAMIFFLIPFSIRSSLPIFLTKKEPQPSGPRFPFAISIHSWRRSVPARMNLPVLTSRPRPFYPRAAYIPPFYGALPSPVSDRVSSVLLLYVRAARSGIAQNASFSVPRCRGRLPGFLPAAAPDNPFGACLFSASAPPIRTGKAPVSPLVLLHTLPPFGGSKPALRPFF